MSKNLIVGGLGLFIAASACSAATITSADFSFGLGYKDIGGGSTWNTSENLANSTPTVQGDFSFSPAPTSAQFSGGGVAFVNRTLGSGNYGSAHLGAAFTAPITASYNGPTPIDAAVTPNYRLEIEITKLSIWAGAYTTNTGGTTMNWDEVTAGHTQSSTSISLLPTGDQNSHTSYKQLVWNPVDYEVAIGAVNNSFTRTFDIIPGGSLWYADGMEVEGRVHLIYDVVPEPAGLASLVLGALAMLRRRK